MHPPGSLSDGVVTSIARVSSVERGLLLLPRLPLVTVPRPLKMMKIAMMMMVISTLRRLQGAHPEAASQNVTKDQGVKEAGGRKVRGLIARLRSLDPGPTRVVAFIDHGSSGLGLKQVALGLVRAVLAEGHGSSLGPIEELHAHQIQESTYVMHSESMENALIRIAADTLTGCLTIARPCLQNKFNPLSRIRGVTLTQLLVHQTGHLGFAINSSRRANAAMDPHVSSRMTPALLRRLGAPPPLPKVITSWQRARAARV